MKHSDGTMIMIDVSEQLLTFIDVGSQGGFQTKWQPHQDKIFPVLFEPIPDQAAALRAGLPRSMVVEAGLSNIVGRRALYITRNELCASLHEPNPAVLAPYNMAPHFDVLRTIDVECTRYDALYQENRVPAPEAIKVDVQGHEFEVLLGFGGLLENCLGVELEAHFYPIYRDQRLFHEIVALLQSYNLVLRAIEKSPNFDDDLVEVNAYFTKPARAVGKLGDLAARKFALLAEVWGLRGYGL